MKMKNHRRNHSIKYKFKCPLCSFSYPIKNILLHHVKNHHGDDAIRSLAKHEQVKKRIVEFFIYFINYKLIIFYFSLKIADGNEPKCLSPGPEKVLTKLIWFLLSF